MSHYVKIKDHVYPTLVAFSDSEKQKGLMGVKWPPPVMCFPFSKKGIHKFWMKNTPSPLDIVFCRNNKVVGIYKGEPYSTASVGPDEDVDFVIELPFGTASEIKLSAGDEIKIINLISKVASEILIKHGKKIDDSWIDEYEDNEQTDYLLNTAQEIAEVLREKSLEVFEYPLETELEPSFDDEGIILTIRLPRELRYGTDLQDKYLELRDLIWEYIYMYDYKNKSISIERINDIADHDDADFFGYYYKFLINYDPNYPEFRDFYHENDYEDDYED